MTRKELDRLLERSVAEALGVEMPQRPRRQPRQARQPALILPRRLAAREVAAAHA